MNPELGGREALDRFSTAAHDAGLRVLLDIVPNHQAASDENPRWREMQATRDTHYFDAWFDGRDELHYRRFFDVGELVGVRVERSDVFRETHALVFELLSAGVVDGLRVDHIDGLVDPEQYLRRAPRRDRSAHTSSSRRSWRGTKPCARHGRSRARPDTRRASRSRSC